MANELKVDIPLEKSVSTSVDKKLRIVKSGEDNSSLELGAQDDGARIRGDLEVSGNITSTSGYLKLPSLIIDEPDATIDATGNFAFKSSGTITLESDENTHQFKNHDGYVMLKLLEAGDHNFLFFNKPDSTTQYFYVEVDNESTANSKIASVGGALIITAGTHVEFDGKGVGFDLGTTTYDATDTIVRFDQGNKQTLTFGSGNITDLYVRFPATSGNFTLILKQDGSGSRTVTNWKVSDSGGADASGSATVKFAGGSNPTLTTDANHVDIISFFWDADAEIAYGVASLDFQF
jgi:hypothetical protein